MYHPATQIPNTNFAPVLPSLLVFPSYSLVWVEKTEMLLPPLLLLVILSQEATSSCLYDPAHRVCCDRGQILNRTKT